MLELPTWGDKALGLPVDLYLIPDDDVPVVHRLDRVSWTDDGSLTVAGWADLRSIDLTDDVDTRITLVVRRVTSGHEVRLPTKVDTSHTLTSPSEDKWADYDKGAFRVTVPFLEMTGDLSSCKTGDQWAFFVQVETGRLRRRVPRATLRLWTPGLRRAPDCHPGVPAPASCTAPTCVRDSPSGCSTSSSSSRRTDSPSKASPCAAGWRA